MSDEQESTIKEKAVGELHRMNFFIPGYQRGYRWTEQQVNDLLNDINEFEPENGSWYCLQPLVVIKKDGKWEVIDGQQRLTTIYLILACLGVTYKYTIEYETRKGSKGFLENISEKNEAEAQSNIDFFYMHKAYKTIEKFFEKEDKEQFEKKLLNKVKFIWYEIGDLDEKKHNLFGNLNSGKIALTNAELIKALFLNKVGTEKGSEREIQQRLIAEEFDQMERAIREDDFWYFVAGNQEKPSSCINLLFDLMLESDSAKYSREETFRTFFYFNEKLKEKSDLWNEVQKVFHILEGWFSDFELYNLIGYLRAVKGNVLPLSELYKRYAGNKGITGFKTALKEHCKEFVNYDNNSFLELRYDEEKNQVFNLLLLFNIASLNANSQEKNRFSFANFHKNKWDVEHISPQNSKDNEELKKIIEDRQNPIFTALKDALSQNNEGKIKSEREKFFATDESLMSIENLTLLTSHDNRGIGNKFFSEKRNKLKEYFQKGSFIPTCSMNVFMKFYSENPQQMDFWDEKDRQSYREAIERTIKSFFGE
ncbi:MAG: DUF262 domain-containing protein [Spirochaetia bacterium]|nr:DUF262 domain-containing protein [Spirochaetia bacterium]